MEENLRELRKLGENAWKFLHECDGHPNVLFCHNVEKHIYRMNKLWHTLDGTWDECYRYTEDFMKKLFKDMRKKPIRKKGKIYPLKSGNSLCDQMNRIVVLAGGYSYGNPNPHLKRADAILERYGKNISATKEWKDAFQKAYDWEMSKLSLDGIVNEAQARTAGYGAAYAVKFPREVYAV